MARILLLLLHLAANGADGYLTNRNLERARFREYDPLARPFVHGSASLAAGMALETGAALYGEHWLRKHGHRQWADALAAGDTLGHVGGSVVSVKEHKGQ